MLSSHKEKKKRCLGLCVLLNNVCRSVCFLSRFGFNRGIKVFLDPLGLLARKVSQVLKACRDHGDPRYVSLSAWRILIPPNLPYVYSRAAESVEKVPRSSGWMGGCRHSQCRFSHLSCSAPHRPTPHTGTASCSKTTANDHYYHQAACSTSPPPQLHSFYTCVCPHFLFSYGKGWDLFTFHSTWVTD